MSPGASEGTRGSPGATLGSGVAFGAAGLAAPFGEAVFLPDFEAAVGPFGLAGPTLMIFGVDRYVEYHVESESRLPSGANTLRSTDVACAGAP